MKKLIVSVIAAFAMAACGGGGDPAPTISTQDALSAIQQKLDSETAAFSASLTERINYREATTTPSFICSDSFQNAIYSMATADLLTALDGFVLWVLKYEGATPAIKYEIGKLISADDFLSAMEKTYKEAVLPCDNLATRNNTFYFQLAAVIRQLAVQDSLRRAGLLAP